ncbi:MAG: hypothetical protein Q9227_001955 [Pyrenula ochraceoflavens]
MTAGIEPNGQSARAGHGSKQINLLDLPPETVKNIPYSDLPALMRVNRDFRELAAAELYRDMCHTFPDENVLEPVDDLVGLLDTLASSEYNYASHIRQITVDSINIGDAGERTYREYLYTTSCGKLLNLSLLMVLRRTKALETFYWNVRIELSPAVLNTLSELTSLRRLNVRLQAGHSLHSKSWTNPGVNNVGPNPPPPPPPGAPASWNNAMTDNRNTTRVAVEKPVKNPRSFSKFKDLEAFSALEIDSLEYIPELAQCIQASSQSLKRVALSFSDSLSKKARESQAAVSDSEFTGSDGEISDNGVPLSPNSSQDGTTETWQMAQEAQEVALARILGQQTLPDGKSDQVEKIITKAEQEVFDNIKSSYQKKDDREFVEALRNNLKLARGHMDGKASKHSKAIDKMEKAATKYLERNEFSEAELKRRKDTAAPKMPVKKMSKPPKHYQYSPYSQYAPSILPPTGSSPPFIPSSQAEDSIYLPPPGQLVFPPPGVPQYAIPGPSHGKSGYVPPSNWPAPANPLNINPGFLSPPLPQGVPTLSKKKKSIFSKSSPSSSNSGSSPPKPASEKDYFPETAVTGDRKEEKQNSLLEQNYDDGIDLDHPDDIGEEVEDQEFFGARDHEAVLATNNVEHKETGGANGSIEATENLTNKGKGKEIIRDPPVVTSSSGIDGFAADGSNASEQRPILRRRKESQSPSGMEEYLRMSHGLALEAVAIHRIPVKPSVLFSAVDVSRLKFLTLLDVGPQRTTWAMLSKVNKTNPLGLESIHTNNVTHSLLVLLNSLQPGTLEELILVEPSARHRSRTVPKTVVSMEDLRNQGLNKHIAHLRILYIRNDDDSSWAFDRETIRLLSRAGALREMVAAMFSEGLHLFLRHLPRLARLHALHVIYFPYSPKHTSTTSVPPNANNVNIVINGAPPLPDPHHPNPPLHAPARMNLHARDAVLSELRATIVDAVALCKQTELEWIGMTYSSAGSGSALRLARLFNWRIEKSAGPNTGPNSYTESSENSENGEGDDEITFNDIIGIDDYLGLADAADAGIAIWDKGVWASKL